MGGGIVAFKSNGNVAIQGNIFTDGSGPNREDLFYMNHSELSDIFLFSSNVGIFIACAKTLITTDNAVIGSSWGGEQANLNKYGSAGCGGAGFKSDGTKKASGTIGFGGNGGSTSGGRPGFRGGNYDASFYGGQAGACIYIVCGRAAIAYNSFSTGGGKGAKYCGGGGTGFGYVACKTLG